VRQVSSAEDLHYVSTSQLESQALITDTSRDWYTPMLFLSGGSALAMMELYTKFKGVHHVC
jgi:hypothetical protein